MDKQMLVALVRNFLAIVLSVGINGLCIWLGYRLQKADTTTLNDTDIFNGTTLGLMLTFVVINMALMTWIGTQYTEGIWDASKHRWRDHVEGFDTLLLTIYLMGICTAEGMNASRAAQNTATANETLWILSSTFLLLSHILQLLTALAVNCIDFEYVEFGGSWNEEKRTNVRYTMFVFFAYNVAWFVYDSLGQTANIGDYGGFPAWLFSFIYPAVISFRLMLAKFWFKKCLWPASVQLNNSPDLNVAPMGAPSVNQMHHHEHVTELLNERQDKMTPLNSTFDALADAEAEAGAGAGDLGNALGGRTKKRSKSTEPNGSGGRRAIPATAKSKPPATPTTTAGGTVVVTTTTMTTTGGGSKPESNVAVFNGRDNGDATLGTPTVGSTGASAPSAPARSS